MTKSSVQKLKDDSIFLLQECNQYKAINPRAGTSSSFYNSPINAITEVKQPEIKNTGQINVRLDPKILELLKIESARKQISLNALINNICEIYALKKLCDVITHIDLDLILKKIENNKIIYNFDNDKRIYEIEIINLYENYKRQSRDYKYKNFEDFFKKELDKEIKYYIRHTLVPSEAESRIRFESKVFLIYDFSEAKFELIPIFDSR